MDPNTSLPLAGNSFAGNDIVNQSWATISSAVPASHIHLPPSHRRSEQIRMQTGGADRSHGHYEIVDLSSPRYRLMPSARHKRLGQGDADGQTAPLLPNMNIAKWFAPHGGRLIRILVAGRQHFSDRRAGGIVDGLNRAGRQHRKLYATGAGVGRDRRRDSIRQQCRLLDDRKNAGGQRQVCG